MTALYGGESPRIIDDERLSAYLDGDLPPAEREAVRRAMQSDPAIAARYRELAATVSLLHTLPAPVLRRSFTLTADQLRDVSPIPAVPTPMPRIAAAPPFPASSTAAAIPLHSAPRVARLTPLFGPFGAIAAVLLLMLISADFATGGFKATSQSRANSASIEQVTIAPPAQSAAQSAPRSPNAITAAPTTMTTTIGTTVAASPASVRTTSATNQPATTTATSTGLPLALIRAVEVALGIIAIAGIVAAIQNSRGRGHATVYRQR